jgi:hypothetical protein
MGVNSRPAFSTPRPSASFANISKPSSSKARAAFLWERVSDEFLIPKRPSCTASGPIEQRVSVPRTIRTGSIDFERPTVIEHSRDWPSDNCDSTDFRCFVIEDSYAEFCSRYWLMMSMVLRYESIGLFERYWD